MKRFLLTIVSLCAMAAAVAGDAPAVDVRVHPGVVLVEKSREGQHLNFDFEVTNRSSQELELTAIRLIVREVSGRFVSRRTVGRNGASPSIDTIPARTIAPGKAIWIFNPFHTFPSDMPLDRLDFEFVVSPTAREVEAVPPQTLTVLPSRRQPRASLRLPLTSRALVHDGNDFYAHHRRITLLHPFFQSIGLTKNPARYALDLCVVDGEGRMHRGDGSKNEDWFSFGAPVVAPAAGEVVRLRNDSPDLLIDKTFFDYEEMKRNLTSYYGNYVLLDLGGGEFLILCHLKQGSVGVRAGDVVKAGSPIGEIGMSGDTFHPHLHMELRDGPEVVADGLPMYFSSLQLWYGATAKRVTGTSIDTGDVVEELKTRR